LTEGCKVRAVLGFGGKAKPGPLRTALVSRRAAIWESGVGLTILGGLVLVLSALWVVMCAADSVGPCLGIPFQGRQGFLELLGLVLLVAGLLLVLAGKRPAGAYDTSANST